MTYLTLKKSKKSRFLPNMVKDMALVFIIVWDLLGSHEIILSGDIKNVAKKIEPCYSGGNDFCLRNRGLLISYGQKILLNRTWGFSLRDEGHRIVSFLCPFPLLMDC